MSGGRKVTKRRIEAAINTLGDLTTEEHDVLDGRTRDKVSHVIFALDMILLEEGV